FRIRPARRRRPLGDGRRGGHPLRSASFFIGACQVACAVRYARALTNPRRARRNASTDCCSLVLIATKFETLRRGAGSYFGRRPSKPNTLSFSGRQARSCLRGTLGGPLARRPEFCGARRGGALKMIGGEGSPALAGPQRAALKIRSRSTPAQRLEH